MVRRSTHAHTSNMSNNASSRTIVITGGLGNLGSKLCHHLLSSSHNNYKVILIEHPNFINPTKPLPHPSATVLPCDLGNPTNEQRTELKTALDGADTLIHFSAVNPYPNATWSESAQSMDHVFYIFQLAVMCKGVYLCVYEILIWFSIQLGKLCCVLLCM